jgi:hypothetical protein
MKMIAVLMLCFLPLVGFTQEKPQNWVCEVNDPSWPYPKKNEVHISLKEPVVTLVYWSKNDNGTYDEDIEPLLTENEISKWKTKKSDCGIKSEFKKGQFVDNYDFHFTCKGIEGSFQMDFKDNTGFYFERLTQFGVQRSIHMHKCRVSSF